MATKTNVTVIEITWQGSPSAVREVIEEGVERIFMEITNLSRPPLAASATQAHYVVAE